MRRPRPGAPRAGFTILELLIAMIVGVAVLAMATIVMLGASRSSAGMDGRSALDRQTRFLQESLQRDLSETGVGMTSMGYFGSANTQGDTLSVLGVPLVNGATAKAYALTDFPGGTGYAMATGACGARCLIVDRTGDTTAFQIAAGDLVRVQSPSRRYIAVVSAVSGVTATRARLTLADLPAILGRPGLLAATSVNPGATVQELKLVAYYRAPGDSLMRADSVRASGVLAGVPVAEGVTEFRARLVFTNGDTLATADTTLSGTVHAFTAIAAIKTAVTIQPARNDARVNRPIPPRRAEWLYAPRNLLYERNRLSGP